jgi:hypothetical protein
MRIRVDIFPTLDGENRFEQLAPIEVANMIDKYGTNDVYIDLDSNSREVRYIHFKKTIKEWIISGGQAGKAVIE